jgi:hypothetical protein
MIFAGFCVPAACTDRSSRGREQPVSELALAYDPNTRMSIMGHAVRRILQRAPDSGATPKSLFIAKPIELLPLNGAFTISNGTTTTTFTVGDYVDDAPPETPRITGGAVKHYELSGCEKEDSCGSGPWTYLEFAIAEHPKDDHTAAERVTYAVYLERSARAATMPFQLLRRPLLLSDGSLSQNISLDNDWADADAFISVSAFDIAGNESPRSEPHQVNAAASGCAISWHRRRSWVSVTALLALAGLAWVRRGARDRSSSF